MDVQCKSMVCGSEVSAASLRLSRSWLGLTVQARTRPKSEPLHDSQLESAATRARGDAAGPAASAPSGPRRAGRRRPSCSTSRGHPRRPEAGHPKGSPGHPRCLENPRTTPLGPETEAPEANPKPFTRRRKTLGVAMMLLGQVASSYETACNANLMVRKGLKYIKRGWRKDEATDGARAHGLRVRN